MSQAAGRHLAVLTYHRVAEAAATPHLYPGLSVAPAEFERQLRYLASRFHTISATDLVEVAEGRRTLPPRALMITFDDGYRDFLEEAWPRLRAHGVPATLFVPTAFPGHPDAVFWWDRLHQVVSAADNALPTPIGVLDVRTSGARTAAYRRVRSHVQSLPHDEAMEVVRALGELVRAPVRSSGVLLWPELRALAAEGVALAPHSRTHPLLHRVPPERAAAEIAGSLEDLEHAVGRVARVFAYPGGASSDALVELTRRAGFAAAVTTARGVNDVRSADWLRLKRINVGRHSGRAAIRVQMSPLASPLVRLAG